jgi:hypothetical protein
MGRHARESKDGTNKSPPTFYLLTGDPNGAHTITADQDPILHAFAAHAHAHQDAWETEERIRYCARLKPSQRRRGRPRNQDHLIRLAHRLQRDGLADDEITSILTSALNVSEHTLRLHTLEYARQATAHPLPPLPRIVTEDELDRTAGFYDTVLVDNLDAYRHQGPLKCASIEEAAFVVAAWNILNRPDRV